MPDYEKFEIGNKAEKLMFLILDATTNRKNYPVKFRRVSDSLQSCAINTVSCILNANNIKQTLPEWKRRRAELQTAAVSEIDKLLLFTKYSLHAKLISSATAETWTSLAHDLKYMTLAWRKSCLQA